MYYVKRDKNGDIEQLDSNPSQESVNLDSAELWAHLGLEYPQRGKMFVWRDQSGKITSSNIETPEERLDDNHPDIQKFWITREKIYKRNELEGQSKAEIERSLPPLELTRVALLPDGDAAKVAARETVEIIQERLATKQDEVAAAETIQGVKDITWE